MTPRQMRVISLVLLAAGVVFVTQVMVRTASTGKATG